MAESLPATPRGQASRLRGLLGSLLAALAISFGLVTPARAQLGDTIPSTAYTGTFGMYYDGDYRDALLAYRAELNSGIKTANARWIDSVCYFTMCGECYYHMGQYPAALDAYTSALKLYSSYYNWMIQVQFPASINPAANGARMLVPWGVTKRATRIGQFPDSFLISQGSINNNNVVAQGGVVQQALMVPIRAGEIVRCTTLAMRRRRELLGPYAKYDPLSNELVTLFARRPAPPNNWSQAWIDVQLGAAYASIGNTAQAVSALERSLVVGGEYDHPLTGTALLELGLLALQGGDFVNAGRLFEEATYASATFSDSGLMEEAFRLAAMTYLLTNQKGVYPALLPATAWARNRNASLHASLATMLAENLATTGQTPAAAQAIAEARASIGRRAMGAGDVGARLNLVTALASYQANQVSVGDQAWAAAMAYQKTGSLWLFHIGLVDSLYMSGDIFDRVATLLYDYVLRDPTPADWSTSPLESLSVLVHPHTVAYDHWFEATLKRGKDPEVALEIADRSRRHRYFSTLPFGGRLLSLRWVMEGPKELLNEQAQLERQDLLARFAGYQQLATQGRKLQGELEQKPVVEEEPEARREQAKKLGELGTLSQSQEVILREIAVRREPAEMVFPPLRKTKDVQQALPDGHALLAFYVTANENLYAFMFSKDKYAMWRVNSPAVLRRHLASMLKDMGNTDHNHQLSVQDLGRDSWRKSAAKVVDLLFEKSGVDLSLKFEELVIVPDGLLWYLPFEALPVGKKDDQQPLLSRVRIRYAPTVGLAVPYAKTQKPGVGHTGVVLGKLYPHDDETVAQQAFEPLGRAVEGSVAIPNSLAAPTSLYRTLLDGLIVLDDIEPGDNPYSWSPAQIDSGKPTGTLGAWMQLPFGGPKRVLLPGFHTAAENGLRKGVAGGNDLFLSVCGLMSTGAQTVLISRWRTAGQTSYDLVREFAQELPHTSAADAWQRSVQLVSEQPLDSEFEPRLKKFAANATPIKAEHPFFWSAYMVVDSGRLEANQEPPPPPAVNANKQAPAPAAGDVKAADKAPPAKGMDAGVPAMAPPADAPAPVGKPAKGKPPAKPPRKNAKPAGM